MKPYYTDRFCTIYHGDCRELLPELSFTVVVTDPPYNLGVDYGGKTDDDRSRAQYADWTYEWFTAANRTGRACIGVTPGIANLGMWLRLFEPRWVLAWFKSFARSRSPVGFCTWEPILLYGKPRGAKKTDVIRAPIIHDKALAGHPCPKPLAWAKGQLSLFAAPEDVVCDPFTGSGTTLVAAKEQGLKAVGIEISEKYCEIAANRLSQEVLW